MITVNELNKSYGKHTVLKNLSFKVEKGDIYGFLGKNGAGKSTTLNILAGLIPFQSGQVKIDATIGYLPEEPIFYNYMTGKEYLNYIGGLQANHDKKRTDELLELVKLQTNKRIQTYSRGMKQRLGLAAALYHNPDILILDEPSSALDPQGRKDMLDTLLKLKGDGKTILLSSHILDDIERICNKIGLIDQGQIQLETQLSELDRYIENTYIIESRQLSKELLETLESLTVLEVENHTYTVYSNHSNLLWQLSTLNVPITGFYQKKQTLEDLFIRMVKA